MSDKKKKIVYTITFWGSLAWTIGALAVSIYCGRPVASTRVVYVLMNYIIELLGWDD